MAYSNAWASATATNPGTIDPAFAHRQPNAAAASDALGISVIGLGYVGVVSVGCLAARDFRVVGVDLDINKVATVAAGRSPIVERGLEDLLAAGVATGRISTVHDVAKAVRVTDVTILAVGTPTAADGGCDLGAVRAACRSIGEALARKPGYHCVILRCSVAPGTTLDVAAPEIEAASGKRLGPDFGICFSPEFLREGSAVADFDDPSKIVIAASDARAAGVAHRVLAKPDQTVLTASIRAAETVKYIDNVWHATKVAFGNEVGRFCKALDVDSHEVMRLFVEDKKLNLSAYYLWPGFAFGGSCLPKEVRAAAHIGSALGVDLPLINSLLPSNRAQVDEAYRMVRCFTGKRIGLLGLTFKPNTDDLRESPMLDLLARLVKDGEIVQVYDPNVRAGPRLSGQLRAMRAAHPELAIALDALEKYHLADSIEDVMATCDVVIATHATRQIRDAVAGRRQGVHVIDLARLTPEVPADKTYHGLSW